MTYHPKHETEFRDDDGNMIVGTALYHVSIDGNGKYYGDRELQCDYANLYGVLIGNHLIVAAMFGADVVAIFESDICDELNEQLALGETPETINFRPAIALAAE